MAEKIFDFTLDDVEVDGADALIARLSVLPGACEDQALQTMLEICEEKVMPYIKEEKVPFRLGALRSSGSVWLDDHKVVNMEFGSPGSGAEEYAVIQHETLSFIHPNGGEAKYLENGLDEWAGRILEAVGVSVKNVLEVTSGNQTEIYAITRHRLQDEMGVHFGGGAGGGGAHAPAAKVPPTKAPPRLVKKKK